jgi:hypothetical protein
LRARYRAASTISVQTIEITAAATAFIPQLLAVEGLRRQLDAALNADNVPAKELVMAAFAQFEEHERATMQHLKAFAKRLNAIEAQIDRVCKSAKVVRRHAQLKGKSNAKKRSA